MEVAPVSLMPRYPLTPSAPPRRALDPCRILWLAVIAQAVADARGQDGKQRRAARAWLLSPMHAPALGLVCGLAGIDVATLRASVLGPRDTNAGRPTSNVTLL